MLKMLQPAMDGVLKRIHRHPLYYRHFNNTLNYRINLNYARFARKCQALYAKEHSGVQFSDSSMRTRAATLVRHAIAPEKARAYSQRISDLIAANDERVYHPDKFKDLQMRVKDPLHTLDVGLLDAFKNPDMHDALLAFFHGNYRLEWVNVFRSLPAERKLASWLWHSDSFPVHTCKIFLHLTPATAERGATEFMNLEDTMAFRRAGYFGQYRDERYADLELFAKDHNLPYRPFHLDAEPGDVTIFDQNFFHRAIAPRSEFRDVMQVFLVPNPIPWDEQFAKDGIEGVMQQAGEAYPKDPESRVTAQGTSIR